MSADDARVDALTTARQVLKLLSVTKKTKNPTLGILAQAVVDLSALVDRATEGARPEVNRELVRDALAVCLGDSHHDRRQAMIVVKTFDEAWPKSTEGAREQAPAPTCDCGGQLTVCASCAVSDYQAAHLDCTTCCPPMLAAGIPTGTETT